MSMDKVRILSDLFSDGASRHRSEKGLSLLLGLLFRLDIDYLRENPDTPKLYDSGVVYKDERTTVGGRLVWPEDWKTVPKIIEDGFGDCEDLACWRAAELTLQGVKARPFWRKKTKNGFTLYHILVTMGGASVEDPSKRLGMK